MRGEPADETLERGAGETGGPCARRSGFPACCGSAAIVTRVCWSRPPRTPWWFGWTEVPPASREAKLTFSTPDGVNFALRTMPERGRVVAHTLRGLIPPSVVLHVLEPTDAYLRWVDAPAVGES